MNSAPCTPAAQYLRMSTEHQHYSLENQSSAIKQYADTRGFIVIEAYIDAAKSGLVLKRRTGLKQLLQDVLSGTAKYKAVLVYDVSRWGRFQDVDESAHYEFLCKTAGVPVHYCAEAFDNDGTLTSLIMKTMKRTMAREYSRELGVKVLAGQKRLAVMGFKQGGSPGYGLRRLLVSADREPKLELLSGQRKSINTDRVTLIPGPSHEVNTVREIYRLLITEKLPVYAIARHLNARAIPCVAGSEWDYQTVYSVLTHPKYAGVHVFGRTSSRLYTPCVRLPPSDWIVTPGAFMPIVEQKIFDMAQQILRRRTINQSDDELLQSLKLLLVREGRLSSALIKNNLGVACASTFRHRFGSLRRAYELIGYGQPQQFGPFDLRRRTQSLREQLIVQINQMFPDEVFITRRGGKWRPNIRLRDGTAMSVLVCRSVRRRKNTARWQIDPMKQECDHMTLLAQLDEVNAAFMAYYLMPNLDRTRRFTIRMTDSWLDRGLRFSELTELFAAVRKLSLR
jgi:DNA invertase Pin-like site-specific DNA recombinase